MTERRKGHSKLIVRDGLIVIERTDSEMKMANNVAVNFPLKLHKPGMEWLVELHWLVDGSESICGLFHSKDEAEAKAFHDHAHRILSCWYVDLVWAAEGKRGERPADV